jgi:NADPH:quinone reductase-like Zn-dependent oxidoreductase
MKAVYITRQGGIEALTYGEQPLPPVGPEEVLIKVGAAALNHLDVYTRAGIAGRPRSFPDPLILGSDVAGTVVEIGAESRRVNVGDRVVFNPFVTCGKCEYCTAARDNLCPYLSIIGAARNGGYAEYAVAPYENVFRIADGIPFEEAAAVPLSFLTAWHMLIGRCELRPGDDVLVSAVGSGVGSAALQIANRIGARVFATAGSDDKLAKARALGADEVINYQTEPKFSARVRELTEGHGVGIVFDSVGGPVWEECFASLSPGGKYVNCGVTGGYTAQLHLGQLFTRQLSILGSFNGTKQEMRELIRAVNRGELKPVLSEVLPLSQARAAHTKMEDRDLFGKLVLIPEDSGLRTE